MVLTYSFNVSTISKTFTVIIILIALFHQSIHAKNPISLCGLILYHTSLNVYFPLSLSARNILSLLSSAITLSSYKAVITVMPLLASYLHHSIHTGNPQALYETYYYIMPYWVFTFLPHLFCSYLSPASPLSCYGAIIMVMVVFSKKYHAAGTLFKFGQLSEVISAFWQGAFHALHESCCTKSCMQWYCTKSRESNINIL